MAARRNNRRLRELGPKDLRWQCPASWIPPSRRNEGADDPLPGLIGQERALDAMEMGLAVNAPGYNVFVSGITGTEKTETVRRILERLRVTCPLVKDHVYVHNFQEPMRPKHLALPPGGGEKLRAGMEDWVRALRREIPRILESDGHLRKRQEFFRRYTEMEEKLFDRLSRRARNAGLVLVKMTGDDGTSYDLYLKIGEETVAPEDLEEVDAKKRPPKEKVRKLLATRDELTAELRKVLQKARALGLRLLRESQSLDEQAVQEVVQALTVETAEELGADFGLAGWLGDCAHFAIHNVDMFRRGAAKEPADEEERRDEDTSGKRSGSRRGLEVFEVNVVRSSPEDGCPAVYELHPTYSNLFGTVERHVTSMGTGFYHLAVRPGSLLQAEGGYLVLNARDVFKEAETWRALKRTLQTERLETHALEGLSPLGVTGVRPEPVPSELKVVLIGDNILYEMLHETDFEFPMIFKVKADFDDSLPLNKEYVKRFIQVTRDQCREEKLLPFAVSGLQSLVERAVRDAGRKNRLSARVSQLMDYAREASYYARKAGKRRVDRQAVESARVHFRQQHALDADWYTRMVLEDVYEIATSGERVGSVNALTVVAMGPLSFGRPARVSAVSAAGDDSYLIIEREVELSGPIHHKGVLILESFIRHLFGNHRTLPIKVSLVFDQSYGPIDGDSASSTEIYALLSAVGNVPMRQDIAVTGAVNMVGELMAVGGVNEKIEGFFQLCKARGLTGEQGVAIPATNKGDLMLTGDVVDAVRAKKFHIWALHNVSEGLELLSGLPAGRWTPRGGYPDESLLGRVSARMDAYEKILKEKDEKSDREERKNGAPQRKKAAREAQRPRAPRRPPRPRG